MSETLKAVIIGAIIGWIIGGLIYIANSGG